MEPLSLVLALCAGLAVAAAAGLRAFLPLLAVGLAARFAGLPLEPSLRWLSSDIALVALGTAAVLEIAGDKIPVVDHALDAIATVVRPVAAAIASYGLLVHFPTPWGQILALLLSGAALAVHAMKAKTRLGSTLLTAGFANPWLSVGEDVSALTLLVLALLVPVLAAVLVIALFTALARLGRRRKVAAPAAPASAGT
jgi:Domain of unknown function (DUF4126)